MTQATYVLRVQRRLRSTVPEFLSSIQAPSEHPARHSRANSFNLVKTHGNQFSRRAPLDPYDVPVENDQWFQVITSTGEAADRRAVMFVTGLRRGVDNGKYTVAGLRIGYPASRVSPSPAHEGGERHRREGDDGH